mgnify:CR=1 FL=1
MADPLPQFPTPEELEQRFRLLAQLYDLGIALREARFVDEEATHRSPRLADRVSDIGPSASPKPDEREKPETDASTRPSS